MATALSVSVQGLDELHERLSRISPRDNAEWSRRALVTCGLLVQKIAAEEMIIRGGRFGTGSSLRDRIAHPSKLTSRSGRLRGSIRVNRVPLPKAIDIGSDVAYAAVHELGLGRFPKRPFLAPALDKASKEFSQIFAKELGRALG